MLINFPLFCYWKVLSVEKNTNELIYKGTS